MKIVSYSKFIESVSFEDALDQNAGIINNIDNVYNILDSDSKYYDYIVERKDGYSVFPQSFYPHFKMFLKANPNIRFASIDQPNDNTHYMYDGTNFLKMIVTKQKIF